MADAAFAAALAAKRQGPAPAGKGAKTKGKDKDAGKGNASPSPTTKTAQPSKKKSALQGPPRRSEAEKTNPLAAAAASGEGVRPESVAEFMEYVLNVNDGIEEYMNVDEDGQMQDDVAEMAGLAYQKSLRRGWSSTESLNDAGGADSSQDKGGVDSAEAAQPDAPAAATLHDPPPAASDAATSAAPVKVPASEAPTPEPPTPEAPTPEAPVAEAASSNQAAEAAEAAMAEAAAEADDADDAGDAGGAGEAGGGFNEDEHVHSNVKRVDAERIIRSRITDGSFLVRRKADNEFVISVWVRKLQTVEHHKVVLSDGNAAVSVNNKPISPDCATLSGVVSHLRKQQEDMSTTLAATDALTDGSPVPADGGVFVHEAMARKAAEVLIRGCIPNGMFLIRQGEADADFKISIWSQALQKVCHHNCTKCDGVYLMKLCQRNADKEFNNLTKSMSAECTTLDAVVKHLRASSDGLGGVGLTTALLPQDL